MKPEREPTVLLEVRDAAENRPLPGASVWVRVTGGKSRAPVIGRTDAAGQYAIDLAGETVSTRARCGRRARATCPERDPLGRRQSSREPRPGVGTRAAEWAERWSTSGAVPSKERACSRNCEVTDGEEVAAAITDAQGVWHSDALPPSAIEGKKARSIELRVSHPDHVTTIDYQVSAAAARAGTLVLTMKQGVSIAGSVLGPDGRPVPGASVVLEQTVGRRCLNRTVTDASGQFHFGRWVNPGSRFRSSYREGARSGRRRSEDHRHASIP